MSVTMNRQGGLEFEGCTLVPYDPLDRSSSSSIEHPEPQNVRSIDTFEPEGASYYLSIRTSSVKHPFNDLSTSRVVSVFLCLIAAMSSVTNGAMFDQEVATIVLQLRYSVSPEWALIPNMMFMMGMSFGVMVFGGASEKYGRRVTTVIPYAVAGLFTIVSGFLDGFLTMSVMRLLCGFFGSAPLATSCAIIRDIFKTTQRTSVVVVYTVMISAGAAIGSITGRVIMLDSSPNHVLNVALCCGTLMIVIAIANGFCFKETFLPVLELQACESLYKRYPHVRFYCRHSLGGDKIPIVVYFERPLKILFTHSVWWMALYVCLSSILTSMAIKNAPEIMIKTYGWSSNAAPVYVFIMGLASIVCGAALVCICNAICLHKKSWNPETRLCSMALGGLLIPFGFVFLRFCPLTHWSVCGVAQVLIQCGFFAIFQAALNYVIDIHYGDFSASAIGALLALKLANAGGSPYYAAATLNSVGLVKFSYIMFAISAVLAILPMIMWSKWHTIRFGNRFTLTDEELP